MGDRPPEVMSYVAGDWIAGERRPDTNPARPQEVVAYAHAGDASTARAALGAAAEAFRPWARTAAPERGRILHRAAALLDERAHEIGREFAREEGKTLAEAVGETQRAAAIFRYFGAQTLEPDGETYPSHAHKTLLFARREPLGVVVAITPWNFPIAIPAWKIAPALAYGNAVVWKPAELVPLTSLRLVEALRDAGLPPGVLNLVIGRGAVVGDALIDPATTSAVTFTGSNAVGRALQLRAVERGIKVQLELGGKNPAVVLADADLDQAAELVARGAFMSAGQKCTATSRVIVDTAIRDALLERLADRARGWRVGDPLDPETRIGPLVSREQRDAVLGFLDEARADGGAFVAGGDPADDLGDGHFVRPAVISGLDRSSRVVREEIFGPVAAVVEADGYDSAVALANDTEFGLSASLFTRDLGSALRFARDIEAGVVKVNQESAGVEFHVPFGGQKESSSGSREQGKVASDFFTQWKTVYVDPPDAA